MLPPMVRGVKGRTFGGKAELAEVVDTFHVIMKPWKLDCVLESLKP